MTIKVIVVVYVLSKRHFGLRRVVVGWRRRPTFLGCREGVGCRRRAERTTRRPTFLEILSTSGAETSGGAGFGDVAREASGGIRTSTGKGDEGKPIRQDKHLGDCGGGLDPRD